MLSTERHVVWRLRRLASSDGGTMGLRNDWHIDGQFGVEVWMRERGDLYMSLKEHGQYE